MMRSLSDAKRTQEALDSALKADPEVTEIPDELVPMALRVFFRQFADTVPMERPQHA